MNFRHRLFPLVLLGLVAPIRADLDPAAWHSVSIPTSGAGNNEWYFFPDEAGNPRVLVKGSGAGGSVNRRLLSGGPPAWTAGDAVATPSLNQQGVLVRRADGGIFLVALHGTNLRVLALDPDGGLQINELVDNTVPVGADSLSAAVDSGGNLHIAYVGRPGTGSETLRYARRTTSGEWEKTSQDLSTTRTPVIRQTAILPSSSSTATIYFTLWQDNVISLLSVSVFNILDNPVIAQPQTYEIQVEASIAGIRRGGSDRMYYFGKGSDGALKFKRLVNGTSEVLEDAAGATAGNIVQANGPDGRQRLAWHDTHRRKFHMLIPSGPADGPPYFAGQPVTAGASAKLRGLHYSPDGTPSILYRNAANQGLIAFPSDAFDFNGNGRADLIDLAMGGPNEGLKTVSPDAIVPGIPFSANRFKFSIPTVGSTITNGAGGLFSPLRNLTYSVETSTNAVVWTPLEAGSPITFVRTSESGTNPDQKRVFTGIYNEELGAGVAKRRFFRVKVKRSVYAY